LDWPQFFESHGIDYVTGPAENVRAGHLGINCPLCPDDTKHHYSVSLDGKVRGCWRSPDHWMGSAALVATLSGVSFSKAREMIGTGDLMATGTSPAALLAQLTAGNLKMVRKSLRMCTSFERFHVEPSRPERRFHDYMKQRGFPHPGRVAREHGLRWCAEGEWKGRIIFPIWVDGKLVAWTGRTISSRAQPRYKAEPPGDGLSGLLWESREVAPKDTLVIVEGPFDALKVAWSLDVTVVALMTNSAGAEKLERLVHLGSRASRTVILLDQNTEAQALRLASDLAVIHPEVLYLPAGVKDPGEMTPEQVLFTVG